ncbi:G protein alpha subunit [Pyrenophora teres f. teres]|nr:G protein alpha subunit [Pyrenophora teres f. teres]
MRALITLATPPAEAPRELRVTTAFASDCLTLAEPSARHSSSQRNDASHNPDNHIDRKLTRFDASLLLGSGESGKSTIVKQMKIIHQNGYTQEELAMYRLTIYKNVIDCAKALIGAMRQFEVTCENPANTELCDYLLEYTVDPDPEKPLDMRSAGALEREWSPSPSPPPTDASSFFDEVERISDPNYIPIESDVLRARTKTTGIYETRFTMGQLSIHMFDVGGQRSERKKWIHCFENVTSIIFCVALSEYDQVLLEESSQNRMMESLVLFDSVVNSRWFMRTSIILFLNKVDLFKAKLARSPLGNYFPDYSGGNDVNRAAKYLLWRFNQVNRAHLNLYPHLTQATDTSNIRLVFAAVKETILQNALKDSGIL